MTKPIKRTPRAAFWDQVASEYLGSGLSIKDVAEEVGASKTATRLCLARRDVRLTPEDAKTLRRRVDDMKPLDAVQFLLSVIEQISWVSLESEHPTDIIDATISQRRLLRALYDANGKPLSKDALLAAMTSAYASADDVPQMKVVDVQVCKLRPKLKGSRWEIVTIWGMGYQLNEVAQ
jgi:hypothetical protein